MSPEHFPVGVILVSRVGDSLSLDIHKSPKAGLYSITSILVDAEPDGRLFYVQRIQQYGMDHGSGMN